jgi:hypothetical protein
VIVYGTHHFGWVDQVDGLGCVATRFFHIMWIPLVPLGTSFLFDDERGVKMPWSLKSIVVAYVRAFFFWSAVASVVAIPLTFGVTLCTAIPLGLAWLLMPFVVRPASSKRAADLMARYGGFVEG